MLSTTIRKRCSGVHSYRQPAGYFPIAGGTFAGESLPGPITWARAYIKNDVAWMDIGRGEVVALPPKVRDAWWEGTTRQWPFMAADLVCSKETVMAHYRATISPSLMATFSARWSR